MNLVYDLWKCPASWDFLQCLINYEIVRRHEGHAELGVHFRPGPKDGFRDDNLPRPTEQRRAILENVMRPALKLVGAVEVEDGQDNLIPYLTRFAVEVFYLKRSVPTWQVPAEYMEQVRDDLRGRRPVVITLREAGYIPERNSVVENWIAFAQSLDDVIFVRDTAKADEPLAGFETCPRASREFLYRAALMEQAKCNLMVANGPIQLAMYGTAPWLNFGAIRPNLKGYAPGKPEWWTRNMGVSVGQQFPWSKPTQRMIWGDDTLENIKAAWASLKPLIEDMKVAC